MNAWYHAKSSARKWGGTPDIYLPIHDFLDSSKQVVADVRHRALYHHTMGAYLCERVFGTTIDIPKKSGTGVVQVPVREVALRHIEEDNGWIPTFADYIDGMPVKTWMGGRVKKEMVSLSVLGIVEKIS